MCFLSRVVSISLFFASFFCRVITQLIPRHYLVNLTSTHCPSQFLHEPINFIAAIEKTKLKDWKEYKILTNHNLDCTLESLVMYLRIRYAKKNANKLQLSTTFAKSKMAMKTRIENRKVNRGRRECVWELRSSSFSLASVRNNYRLYRVLTAYPITY